MAFILIDEKEHEIRKGEVRMSAQEVSELMEYSDIVEKWLKKNINRIQCQLASCNLQGREQEAYTSINCIKKLIEDLHNTEDAYMKYVNEVEKLKDNKWK